VISEGATVASESTLLGVPVIYINSRESDMITAHERWGLLTHFRKFNGLIDKTEEILSDRNSKGKSIFNRDRMLETQIDVSAFLKWFIENFPGSQKILAREPNYQDRFKTGHNSA
jgi:predicted glycosyltransferase